MAGSKREKAPGVWELRVSLGRDPLTGKLRQRSRTFRGGTRAADRALAALIAETAPNRSQGSTATVETILAKRMEIVWRDRSPTTAYGYQSKIDRYLLPALGSIPLANLTAQHLDDLYQALGDKGLAPRTIRQTHAIIAAALELACDWGWVPTNVARRAHPPGIPSTEDPEIDLAAIRTMAAAAAEHDPDLGVMVGVKLKLGCRRGELCGLQWRDVDLDAGQVRIRRSVVRRGDTGRLEVKDTKGHAGRSVSIDAATVSAFDGHRVRMVERAALLGMEVGPRSFVFSRHPSGETPLVPDTLSQAWRRLRQRVGIEGLRLHDLRHAHATFLIDAGIPIPTVSKRLGHSRKSTTEDIYAHAVRSSDRRAAEVAGELL